MTRVVVGVALVSSGTNSWTIPVLCLMFCRCGSFVSDHFLPALLFETAICIYSGVDKRATPSNLQKVASSFFHHASEPTQQQKDLCTPRAYIHFTPTGLGLKKGKGGEMTPNEYHNGTRDNERIELQNLRAVYPGPRTQQVSTYLPLPPSRPWVCFCLLITSVWSHLSCVYMTDTLAHTWKSRLLSRAMLPLTGFPCVVRWTSLETVFFPRTSTASHLFHSTSQP